MKMRRKRHRAQASAPQSLRLVMLCAFFAVGIVAGHAAQYMLMGSSNEEISSYLQGYAAVLTQGAADMPSVWRVLAVYLRGPALLFLLGFCTFGAIAIPLVCVFQGFTLAFAVSCFSFTLGEKGPLLALSAFGVRGMAVLPCMLFIAQWAYGKASGHPECGSVPSGALRRSMLVCLVVLLLCALLEITVVPRLLLQLIGS